MRRSKSHNEKILYYLIRNDRRSKSSINEGYLIFYAFLYKYLSDKLKKHLLYQLGGDGDDLKFFYQSDASEIREMALRDLGYFFERYDAYLDQFVADKFADDILNPEFVSLLKDNIVFSKDNPCEEYFNTIMETVENQTKFYRMSYDHEQELIISNSLLSIAKLDIDEEEFSFKRVYDLVASSRHTRLLSPTPEYIAILLERIISSKKDFAEKVYDPFFKDSANLINVSKSLNSSIYGKESNDLYYFYSLIKAFIHECDFGRVFLRHENAINSMAFDDELFDVIVSKIPNDYRYSRGMHSKQNLEAPNPNKKDIKEQVISKYDLSELGDDEELLNALSILERKVEAVEKSNIVNFQGEYESLIDSEFLFVINMINSLKEDGLMAISVSQNFLFKNSLATLRKFLTHENNYIDTIISLPEKLAGPIRPEVIIVFSKNRKADDVLFINVSDEDNTKPSKNAIPGRLRRNLVLDDSTLDKIVDVFTNRRTIDKFSKLIRLKELSKNDFNLTVSRYVDTYQGTFIRLEDLKSDKQEIDKNLDNLTKKIDMMMDELDINL